MSHADEPRPLRPTQPPRSGRPVRRTPGQVDRYIDQLEYERDHGHPEDGERADREAARYERWMEGNMP